MIEIFTTNTCGWCKKLMSELDDKGVAYTSQYLDEDTAVLDRFKNDISPQSGKVTVPQTVIDGEVYYVGYKPSLSADLAKLQYKEIQS